MKEDNRNFILAIVLSMLIIVGWNYFYAQPMLERQRKQVEQEHQPPQPPGQSIPQPSTTGVQPAPPPAQPAQPNAINPSSVAQPRDVVIQRSPRLPVKTPSLDGSINLKGGEIDDLRLTRYRETVDPKSPTIVLL